MMSKVKEVFNDNEDAANTWMEERRMYLMLTNVKGSVKSVRSGVTCWILFSIAFLTYGPGNSLPPACGMHVARWLCLFRNAGTAANYVSYIRFACRFKDLSMAWDDETVRLTLKGLKKDHMTRGGPQKTKWLLTYGYIGVLYTWLLQEQLTPMAMLVMFGFEFLLRVESEGLVVFKGDNDDYLELKRDNQPNAVWMADDGKLVFRMRQRKNRQTGSLLFRSCTCDNPKVPYCMVC